MASVASPDAVPDVLRQAVVSIFSRWYALQAVVQHAEASDAASVAQQLVDDACILATSTRARPDEDDYLDLMEDTFQTLQAEVEDGSMEEIAKLLVRMRDTAAQGDLTIARGQIAKSGPSSQVPTHPNPAMLAGTSPDSEDSEMNGTDGRHDAAMPGTDIAASKAPLIDDDGFQTVTRRKTRSIPPRAGHPK